MNRFPIQIDRRGTLLLAFALFPLTPFLSAAPGSGSSRVPDLTGSDKRPKGVAHDLNLGATGARGWMHSHKMVTTDARQILVTKVEAGSPAEGVLKKGDVILGVGSKSFSDDPRTEFGEALKSAEIKDGGILKVRRWREGQVGQVEIRLPALGDYSATAPFRCEKSAEILQQGCRQLAARLGDSSIRQNPITRSLNGLALLASGEPGYHSLLKPEAEWAADFRSDSFQTWWYGYVMTFLAEYVMATGDESVLPGLKRLALEAVEGQSIVGSWGHRFAGDDGRLKGYGMMNSPGIPLTIGLVLAKKAGVDDPAVAKSIERSVRLLRFYAGKGAIPYGDHHPWIQTHEDNGKCGMAAVLFNLLGEREHAEFFSRMSLASHGAERDTGHTGNFFNLLWSLPAVAQLGSHASGAWMDEFGGWYFDLARQADGTFVHQGPPGPRKDSYAGWDCTGAYLLSYAVPLRKIYLTGKGGLVVRELDHETAAGIIADGRGWDNKDRNSVYDALTADQLVERLGSWSPVVRERAAMALGRRKDDLTERLVTLLDSPQPHLRYGACQALKQQRGRAAEAVGPLRKAFNADDLWLRVLAADALAGIGDPARVAIPDLLARLTKSDLERDPRNMEQRYLSFALFNQRGGLLARSLDGVDHDLLFRAVRAGLQNEDGRARGSYSSVYRNLSFDQLEPLLPAIHRAIVEPAPSGIMFADGIRTSGLELFTKHHVSEGVELLADYALNQKKHGSQKRIIRVMEMLKSYGAHAQRVVPSLHATADYFENREEGFPKKLSQDKAKIVRDAIAAIEASTDKPKLKKLAL